MDSDLDSTGRFQAFQVSRDRSPSWNSYYIVTKVVTLFVKTKNIDKGGVQI